MLQVISTVSSSVSFICKMRIVTVTVTVKCLNKWGMLNDSIWAKSEPNWARWMLDLPLVISHFSPPFSTCSFFKYLRPFAALRLWPLDLSLNYHWHPVFSLTIPDTLFPCHLQNLKITYLLYYQFTLYPSKCRRVQYLFVKIIINQENSFKLPR